MAENIKVCQHHSQPLVFVQLEVYNSSVFSSQKRAANPSTEVATFT